MKNQSLDYIFWQDGNFLHPQHFQHIDLRMDVLYQHAIHLNNSDNYGTIRIVFDEAALKQGKIQLQEGEFLFQNSIPVIFGKNTQIKPILIPEDSLQKNAKQKIYLALSHFEFNAKNISTREEQEEGNTKRFIDFYDTQITEDIYLKSQPVSIEKIHFQSTLVLESDLHKFTMHEFIPIGRLIYNGIELSYDSSFIPPVICIKHQEALLQFLRTITDDLMNRWQQMKIYKQKMIGGGQLSGYEIKNFNVMSIIGKYASMFNQFIMDGSTHPKIVYQHLRQLVSELSAYSESFTLFGDNISTQQVYPYYDHLRLHETLKKCHEIVQSILSEVTQEIELKMTFERKQGLFTLGLGKSFFESKFDLYICVSTLTLDKDRLLRSFNTLAKICTPNTSTLINSRALPGVELEALSKAPEFLPQNHNRIDFKIKQQGDLWSAILREGSMACSWADAPLDCQIQLFGMKR